MADIETARVLGVGLVSALISGGGFLIVGMVIGTRSERAIADRQLKSVKEISEEQVKRAQDQRDAARAEAKSALEHVGNALNDAQAAIRRARIRCA